MAKIPNIKVDLSRMPSLNSEQAETIAVALNEESSIPIYKLEFVHEGAVYINTQYDCSVIRIEAPASQKFVEIRTECDGGTISTYSITDSVIFYPEEWDANIEFTPTSSTCTIKISTTINGKYYLLDELTVQAEEK